MTTTICETINKGGLGFLYCLKFEFQNIDKLLYG